MRIPRGSCHYFSRRAVRPVSSSGRDKVSFNQGLVLILCFRLYHPHNHRRDSPALRCRRRSRKLKMATPSPWTGNHPFPPTPLQRVCNTLVRYVTGDIGSLQPSLTSDILHPCRGCETPVFFPSTRVGSNASASRRSGSTLNFVFLQELMQSEELGVL